MEKQIYNNYTIFNKDDNFLIIDNNGNLLCDNMGCELLFASIDEAKKFLDTLFN